MTDDTKDKQGSNTFATWSGHFENKGHFRRWSGPAAGATNPRAVPPTRETKVATADKEFRTGDSAANSSSSGQAAQVSGLINGAFRAMGFSSVAAPSLSKRREDRSVDGLEPFTPQRRTEEENNVSLSLVRGSIVEVARSGNYNFNLAIVVGAQPQSRVIVVPCEQRNSSLGSPSVVNLTRRDNVSSPHCARCDWITTLPAEILKPSKMGELPPETMEKIDQALCYVLGLQSKQDPTK